MKYKIGNREFKTKKALSEAVREVLYGTPIGQNVVEQFMPFIVGLLERHPSADEKIGCGVMAIKVVENMTWKKQPMFVIVRTDRSEADFSYIKCVDAKSRDDDRKSAFRRACRTAVAGDVLSYKKKYFLRNGGESVKVPCEITGKEIGWNDCHVDHEPPWTFRRIISAFVNDLELSPESIETVESGGPGEKHFADDGLKQQFRDYHNRKANLRVVEAVENLKLSKE